MISVKKLSKLVGKRVVTDSGVLGTIVEIVNYTIEPIKVRFDNGNVVHYRETGAYASIGRHHITLVDYTIEAVISDAMATFGITPEELIAIILERHCE